MLKIKKGQNNHVLRKKSLETELNSDIRKLIEEMKVSMVKNNGAGLAAPQVGQNVRLFIISKEYSPACRRGRKKLVFINPEIIKISKKTICEEEGCLSLPGEFIKVDRAKTIKIKALNEKGEEFKLKAKGLLARIIQHELDHLNGILIVDKQKTR